MLSGKGFKEVYNVAGGIKAWRNEIAVGPEDLGLSLFSGRESVEETLIVAYGLEQGLRDFYLDMKEKVRGDESRALFTKLADIEIIHQNDLVDLHRQLTGETKTREDFEREMTAGAMEGGLSTGDYLALYKPDPESVVDIVSLAMAIEAQALDLYQRAADRSDNSATATGLLKIAEEERTHLAQLGRLIDSLRPGEQ